MKGPNLLTISFVASAFLLIALGCGGSSSPSGPKSEWTKSKRLAGKEGGLSHVSSVVADDRTAFVVIGGTVADENEGTNGVRKIDLASGQVSMVDNGENMPQSENGGLTADDKYIYWNGGGKILRCMKDGGKPEVVASENVGIGIDMAVDGEKVYWANHGYYSPNVPSVPKPVYSVAKAGGKPTILADQQNVPGSILADDKFVYWKTLNGIFKIPKTGGQPQPVYQAGEDENIDVMQMDDKNLYFGFRPKGESRWALERVAKDGGDPQMLIKSFSLKPFVVDEANIYFFDEAGLNDDILCRLPKNGGDAVHIDTGYYGGAIAQTRTKVFFGSLDTIFSIGK